MQKVLHMSTKNALITKIWKKLKKLSQIDVLSSPKCSPIYYAFHFKEVLILSKINSFACESGVKKKFVVRCIFTPTLVDKFQRNKMKIKIKWVPCCNGKFIFFIWSFWKAKNLWHLLNLTSSSKKKDYQNLFFIQ